jgi:hypothetical protein
MGTPGPRDSRAGARKDGDGGPEDGDVAKSEPSDSPKGGRGAVDGVRRGQVGGSSDRSKQPRAGALTGP